ncbi:unnamed protein product [Darwinula stevensoni]|uniref:AIG1-type G domain-containing protein n=1 Tax=Darwinula stevensoni TaxID=69355 RepID=A0A7R9A4X6_9CRUS|nr:unnamed protein product [Darwinula stevensoni]CAG0884297.1 unnamed protein product [Darwinula stevensoni]
MMLTLLEKELSEEKATWKELKERLKSELSIREELEQNISKIELELQKIKTQKEEKGTMPSHGKNTEKEAKLTLAQRMKENCKIIKKNIHELPTKKLMEDREKRLAKYEIGNERPGSGTGKVILLVGGTGAGRSTLINGIVNFVFGMDYHDSFRFKLISDENKVHHSQTKWITAYQIHMQQGFALSHSLTIIDTPGFGNTEGIRADEELKYQIREFFSYCVNIGVDQLNAICIVVQSSLARFTPTQKYIFDSILSVFGNDVMEKMYLFITFADNKRPSVLDAIKGAKVPNNDYFKFNNSALFSDSTADGSDECDKFFWQMGVTSFKKFFEKVLEIQPVSLTLTKEVLQERQQLETAFQGIEPQITAMLKQYEAKLEANKDFTYTVKVQKQEMVDLETGVYATNCLRCNFTCHYPCTMPHVLLIDRCIAMPFVMETGEATHCTVCPAQCPPDQHVNNQYRFVLYEEDETKTSDELKAKYEQATGKKATTEGIVKNLFNNFNQERANILNLTKRAHECLQKLDIIARKPDPLGFTDYIDLLIQTEQREARPGYVQRIKYLQDTKGKAELAEKLKQGFDPFKEYMKDFEVEGFDISISDPNSFECEVGSSDYEDDNENEVHMGLLGRFKKTALSILGIGEK